MDKITDINSMHNFDTLLSKINRNKAKICVVGLGYVGLPLIFSFCKKNFEMIGYDNDKEKINLLVNNKSYISSISDKEIKEINKNYKIYYSSNEKVLIEADIIICCLPTPITKNFSPEMKYIKNFINLLSDQIQKSQLIILESTTYPGTCDDYLLPLIKEKKLSLGKDIFVGYSPEREDPGNKEYSLKNTPKVVAGSTVKCLSLVKSLYSKISLKVVPVNNIKTAEAVKIYENIFRSINISLVNEMHIIFSRLGINIYEVIKAAKTKPFGFMPFYPGPGLGGHCIPIDPHLINWVAKSKGYTSKFIDLSAEINIERIEKIFGFIIKFFFLKKININQLKILIIGVAYKKNTNDCRESPALKFIELLKKSNISFDFYDPYVEKLNYFRMYGDINKKSIKSLKNIKNYSCSIILTDHEKVDYKKILKESNYIFDTRGVYQDKKNKKVVDFIF